MFCLHSETKNHASPPGVGHANKTYRQAVVAKLKKPEISIFNKKYFEFANNVSIFGN